jgi:hypothetical protein
MKQFKYVITDEVGLHARPAGLLAKKAKEMKGADVTVQRKKRGRYKTDGDHGYGRKERYGSRSNRRGRRRGSCCSRDGSILQREFIISFL